jgi:signal recognition particle GTPase
MRPYTFNHFVRDFRNVGQESLALRVVGWLTGFDLRIRWPDEATEMMARSHRVADAIAAAMTPAERRNPRQLLESRRLEIADVAKISDSELAAVLHCYDTFARLAPAGRRQWWQEVALAAIFFVLLTLLVVALIGLVALIWYGVAS